MGLHNVWKNNGRKYRTVNDAIVYVNCIVGLFQNVGN